MKDSFGIQDQRRAGSALESKDASAPDISVTGRDALFNEAATKIEELRRERDSARATLAEVQQIAVKLYKALRLLLRDVREYPAWARPCDAVEGAEDAIRAFEGEDQ